MVSLIIDTTKMEITGKFDSRQRFLRTTASIRDAYFSRGQTFAFTISESNGDQALSWAYRNGPVIIQEQIIVAPPSISDTSVGVSF